MRFFEIRGGEAENKITLGLNPLTHGIGLVCPSKV